MFMSALPSVSVIIPLHNGAASIERCLAAIDAQRFDGKVEVLVVNNNSKDNGAGLVETLGHTVLNEPTQGAGAARNCGIKAAKGEFLAFLDADVLIDPNWIDSCVRAIQPKWIDCVQSAIIPDDADQETFMFRFRKKFISQKTGGKFNYLQLIDETFPVLNSSAFMIKANYLKQKNIQFSEELTRCEDTDFTNRLTFAGCHFAVVSDTKALVLDDRNPVEYLMRSFKIGQASAEVRSLWGGPHINFKSYLNRFAQIDLPKSQEDMFVLLNHVSSMAGDVVSAANIAVAFKKRGSSAAEFLREDRRNPYFLRVRNNDGEFELSKMARMVWHKNGATILDLKTINRCFVDASGATALQGMMNACVVDPSTCKVSAPLESNLVTKMIERNVLVPVRAEA
jgi:glycosyltransferase involved in cell wall biosynthesis